MDTSVVAPVADWVTVDELVKDPYPTYERLRRESPVAYVPQIDRYLITSFRECFDAEMDQETFSAHERVERSPFLRAIGRPMLRKDDPQHKIERNAIGPALRPIAIKKHWASVFRDNAVKHISKMRDLGPGADLFKHFAVPYAADNLSAVIGFDDVAHEDMRNWSHTLIRGASNVTNDPAVWDETDLVCDEIDAAVERVLRKPGDPESASLISAMLRAGRPEDELRANVRLTISGGMNEPSHVIASAVWALSAYPRQRDLVFSGKRTFKDAFEETARLHSPVGMYPRRTTRDVEVGGVTIPEGATASLVVASANRDETQFDRPDAFDLDRESVAHLAFGNGTHICAGNWVARSMVGEIGLPALYEELPNLTVEDPDSITFRGWVFRGATALPVVWDAR